jgi:hypothetical protein
VFAATLGQGALWDGSRQAETVFGFGLRQPARAASARERPHSLNQTFASWRRNVGKSLWMVFHIVLRLTES